MSTDLNMIESIQLPSRGLLYPSDHPFHNKEEIEIRLLNAIDENLLTNKSLIQSGKLLDEITKEVLIDKTVDINSLLLEDRNAILIYSRIYFLGTDYKSICRCKYCGETEEYNFDISTIPVKELEELPLEPNTNIFKYITSRKNEIVFQFPTVGIIKDMEKDLEMKKKVQKKHAAYNTNKEENITTLYKYIIKSINGKTEYKDILSILEKMPILESREFREYMQKITFKVEFEGDYVCLNCGKQTVGEALEFNSNFFWSNF